MSQKIKEGDEVLFPISYPGPELRDGKVVATKGSRALVACDGRKQWYNKSSLLKKGEASKHNKHYIGEF